MYKICTNVMYTYFRANGQVTINTTVPDTITSWVASAFVVNSKSGLGVSQLAKVYFKPFS